MMQIRNSKKNDKRQERGPRLAAQPPWWQGTRMAGGGQNLPVHAVDRVRLVMVPSLLVSHVNR